ncbi:hypothetical protein OG215_15345 [Streptomyces globisporus]|uniref:hypothetical protein n=1 Tax=Streptomyces globisporus TaxID=1908 RepID=UPI00386473B7|nr:hypothetical protein OG215_15345 [Streptomyces globisporus]
MSVDTSALSQPLYDPAVDGTYVPPLDIVLACAREELARYATANIHDHHEVLVAAVSTHDRLRQLVAALDKEAGR